MPEQRGHGYAYDLLVECTHFLAERGAEFIAGATDQGNFPMAANFAKAGIRSCGSASTSCPTPSIDRRGCP